MRFLARLFSYTRDLEDQRVAANFRIEELKQQLEAERLRNVRDLEVLREQLSAAGAEIEQERDRCKQEVEIMLERYADARNDLEAANSERCYLQDRLCQKLGLPPIFEPSPGQVAQQEQSGKPGSLIRKGPRDTAIAAGIEVRGKQKEAIKTEVADFLKQEEAKNANASANHGSSNEGS